MLAAKRHDEDMEARKLGQALVAGPQFDSEQIWRDARLHVNQEVSGQEVRVEGAGGYELVTNERRERDLRHREKFPGEVRQDIPLLIERRKAEGQQGVRGRPLATIEINGLKLGHL